MPAKKSKHPRDMNSEELAAHIFHPKLHEHLKAHVAKSDEPKPKKTLAKYSRKSAK
jgi:hypothetical protein